MKPILSIFLLLFLISCEKEPSNKPIPQPKTLDDLNLEGLKALVPIDIIKSNDYAVFVNQNGDEKYLKITVSEGYKNFVFESIQYKSEFFEYNLSDSSDMSYGMSTKLSNQYSTLTRVDGLCSVALLSGYNNGYFPTVTLDRNGNVIFGKALDSIVICNKTFNNVTTQLPPPSEFESYSKLYFSKELGIVGFQGNYNEMWALDRYE